MLIYKKSFHQIKTLFVSGLLVSLASCTAGTEISNSPTNSASSPQTPTPTPSPSASQTTASPASLTIPGVNNITEVNFKTPSGNSPNGVFDTINGSTRPTIQVSKATPLTATGWAVIPGEKKTADRVILTYGDNNSLVAVAPVNLERIDVVKALNNPAYLKSGWIVTFNSSTLPTEQVVFKAWAYDSARKEATQLTSTHEVVIK